MKPSGIGGMAVIEGVMMRNKSEYAIAVRKPNNEIAVEKKVHKDFSDKVKLFKLPIFRGILAFVDSMVIGMKVLNFSASFFEEEEEEKGKEKKKSSEKSNALLMVFAIIISLLVSVSLFMVLPVLLSNLFARWIESIFLLSLMEGILRLLIFIGYILLASQMKEIKRVFMYHGAEHKTINCLENGFELTTENVKTQSKAHKRCGTSFMLLVMLISLVFFVILRPETLGLRVLSRVLLVPAIAGIAYEFIRFAGRSESRIVNIISKPGLWMQALTTKEPDLDMIEVAIKSVDTVFDWKAFLESQVSEGEIKESSRNKKASSARDNKKDSSAKDSKKASSAKDSKKASSARDNKKDSSAIDNKKLSSAKDNMKVKNVQEPIKAQEENLQEDKSKVEDSKAAKARTTAKVTTSAKVTTEKATTEKVTTEKATTAKAKTKSANVKDAKDNKKASYHKKKDEAKEEYAVAGEISIASPKREYEEDDEILKALDKYLDFNEDK